MGFGVFVGGGFVVVLHDATFVLAQYCLQNSVAAFLGDLQYSCIRRFCWHSPNDLHIVWLYRGESGLFVQGLQPLFIL